MLKKIYSNQTPVRNLGDGITLFPQDTIVVDLGINNLINIKDYYNYNISDGNKISYAVNSTFGSFNIETNILTLSNNDIGEKTFDVTIKIVDKNDDNKILSTANLKLPMNITGTIPDAADDV